MHLERRLIERQWAVGTTEQEYLSDLQLAIWHPTAWIAVYRRRGGNLAAILVETLGIVPAERRGARWLPTLFVV